MKKLLLLAAICSSAVIGLYAQNKDVAFANSSKARQHKTLPKLKGSDVSYQTREQFKVDFPNAAAKSWKRGELFDEVVFTRNNTQTTAFYDENAKLVGTTEIKQLSDVPQKARDYISKKYAGYTVTDVMLFDDNEDNATDMVLFDRQFEDADNYFIELQKGKEKIVLASDPAGQVSYFARL
ncbi:MAG: hypothetical protein KA821_03270 [Chitinophagaceae bacterium]|nr:hypothetical protein [Chitinophagaceae bacterium]